ncbi:MAG: lysophospholipid acyltransferase family protein [Nitrospirae bacterium]|nr:lysophospholipid acyltransferase family protein [Nitrospirota bacterium]
MIILPLLGFLVVLLIRMTVRIKRVGEEFIAEFYKKDRRFILAFWHGRQLFMPFSYDGKLIHILISQHGDGEIVTRAMRYFGFQSVRGSSTRGGFRAVRELLRLSGSSDIAITPDGPKGPAYKVQMGIIELARMTSLPIIPVTFSSSSRKELKAWDHFLIPHLFSKGIFIWGKPIRVEKNLTREQLEERRKDLEITLNKITEEADRYFLRTC